jgi:hypothetical protein
VTTGHLAVAQAPKRQRIAPSSKGRERKDDMFEKQPEKMKQAAEHAKEAIDREDDKLEQVAEKAEPYLHEARERWAKAEREAAHPDEHEHH